VDEAIQKLIARAELGDAEAQYELGMRYSHGRGVAINDDKSFQWLQKAARNGQTDAQYELGLIYAYEFEEESRAEKLFLMAARKGHTDAQFQLGCYYGRTLLDHYEAYLWLSMATAQDHVEAAAERKDVAASLREDLPEAQRDALKLHGQIERRVRSLSRQKTRATLDQLVALALGEKDGKLPSAEELMNNLILGSPVATESITSPVDPDDLAPEACAQHLERHASPQRCAEIANGAALSSSERRLVTRAATVAAEEGGTFDFVRYYRVTDSKGRSVYFSNVSGDELGSYGPRWGHRGPMLELPYAVDTSTQLGDGTVVNFCIIE
jgi:hypothetical protein